MRSKIKTIRLREVETWHTPGPLLDWSASGSADALAAVVAAATFISLVVMVAPKVPEGGFAALRPFGAAPFVLEVSERESSLLGLLRCCLGGAIVRGEELSSSKRNQRENASSVVDR